MDGWPIRQQARRITHAHWAPSAIVSAQSCIGESLGLVFVTCIFPFSSCSVFIHIHICVCVCVLYDNACMYHEESSQNMHDFWPRNLILLPFGFFLSLLCNDFVSLNWWWCYLKQCQGMGCVWVCVCVCVWHSQNKALMLNNRADNFFARNPNPWTHMLLKHELSVVSSLVKWKTSEFCEYLWIMNGFKFRCVSWLNLLTLGNFAIL